MPKQIIIPKKFKERYKDLVENREEFLNYLLKPLPRAFRINTLKTTTKKIKTKFTKEYKIKLKSIPWYKDAFISDTPKIVGTPEYLAGHIYIQELTSMIPVLTIKKELENSSYILDGCAAPGSKTTQIAQIKNNQGTIIANELSYPRIKALKFNLEKAGALNTIITNQDLRYFPQQEFDIVLVDAPCSSEGTTRKKPQNFLTWSEKDIIKHSRLQKQLIYKAYQLLKKGGTLIYSTCTFAPEENEEVVNNLLDKTDAKLQKISLPKLKTSSGITKWKKKEYSQEVKKCIRIYPHYNNTGGFFIAKIRK